MFSTLSKMLVSSTDAKTMLKRDVPRKGLAAAGKKNRLKPFATEFVNMESQSPEDYVYASDNIQQAISREFKKVFTMDYHLSEQFGRQLTCLSDRFFNGVDKVLLTTLMADVGNTISKWRMVGSVKWTESLNVTFWKLEHKKNDHMRMFELTVCCVVHRSGEVVHTSLDQFLGLELSFVQAYVGKNCIFITDNCPERRTHFVLTGDLREFLMHGLRIDAEHEHLLPAIIRHNVLPRNMPISLMFQASEFMDKTDFLLWTTDKTRLQELKKK
jgi:hypothetical protein